MSLQHERGGQRHRDVPAGPGPAAAADGEVRVRDRGHGFVRVFRAGLGRGGSRRVLPGDHTGVRQGGSGVSITYMTYELLKRSIGVDTGRL